MRRDQLSAARARSRAGCRRPASRRSSSAARCATSCSASSPRTSTSPPTRGPKQVKPLFRRAFIIGRRFRLVHVHAGTETIEVSTFRAAQTGDDATDEHGRLLSDNVYGSQAEDAARRDFTINALYFDPATEEVWDYVGGVADVRARRLKLIGPPVTRFREDPVRMLRAVRLAAKLGVAIDPKTAAPIPKLAPLISNVPAGAAVRRDAEAPALRPRRRDAAQPARARALPRPAAADRRDPRAAARPAVHRARARRHRPARARGPRRVARRSCSRRCCGTRCSRPGTRRRRAASKPIPALFDAMDAVLAQQAKQIAIPRRFEATIKEIWSLQPRFEQRAGQRPFRLLEHPRFRAGWDFLDLRCQSGELDGERADSPTGGTRFAARGPDERDAMLRPDEAPKKRRRSRGAAAGASATSAMPQAQPDATSRRRVSSLTHASPSSASAAISPTRAGSSRARCARSRRLPRTRVVARVAELRHRAARHAATPQPDYVNAVAALRHGAARRARCSTRCTRSSAGTTGAATCASRSATRRARSISICCCTAAAACACRASIVPHPRMHERAFVLRPLPTSRRRDDSRARARAALARARVRGQRIARTRTALPR